VTAAEEANAWNPGIQSPVPAELRHLCTIFRADNARTSVETADELHDLTGLAATELVAFRPERLALHELLIRVSADYAVPNGTLIEDLGINFRQMIRRMLATQIEPHMADIVASFDQVRQRVATTTQEALAGIAGNDAQGPALRRTRPGLFARFAPRRAAAHTPPGEQTWDLGQIEACERRAAAATDELERSVYRALARVMAAVFNRHGGAWGARSLISSVAMDLACNEVGGDAIGRTLEPLLERGAAQAGYYRLPRQDRPLVMNTKGPSAAGKSSLRPLQRELAGDIGVRWDDFALISPDIWRKQLLDYQSLGAIYKYAGPMSADELQIVDAKLDRYMARKHERGDMSHLLIDRFRFDSFAPNSNEAGSNLLTRFGQTVYLFFVIASPESLVERAWKRGLEFGRFKAVGDTLAHSVQAYAGMPDLFFTWIRRGDKSVHFEFLDNSVRLGERPRTAAFGNNQALHVLDVGRLLDIERFRRINIAATAPEQLYPDPARLAPGYNTGFLQRCVEGLREVTFAEQATGRVYLRIVAGKAVAADREWLASPAADADTRAGVCAVAPNAFDGALPSPDPAALLLPALQSSLTPTLGQWGGQRSSVEGLCA
jgi:hypothetical protein